MADGHAATAGPYVQARGTTVTEPPITFPQVRVQVRMQILAQHVGFPCELSPLIVQRI
jgi:hypothetical protein